jgi:hypothetical protein
MVQLKTLDRDFQEQLLKPRTGGSGAGRVG